MKKELQYEFIVISLSIVGAQKWFNGVIECDYYAIMRYVEDMKFKDELMLCFYSIEDIHNKSWIKEIPVQENRVEMNNAKSLVDFKEEVSEMLEYLQIKKEQEK